jgi:anti-sigma factor ChrR (cupin superfamily)
MNINSDYSLRAVMQSQELPWVDSPAQGIQRKMLERDGGEVARATSIVRYAPGSSFPAHVHELGEEILVLEGDFFDESGTYGPGAYLKNPPSSSHAPGSVGGCTLLVKLRHMDARDAQAVRVDTRDGEWLPGLVPGLSVMPLSGFGATHTALVRWAPGTRFTPHRHYCGEEIYVVEGVFEDEFGRYPAGAWLRSPHLSAHQPFSMEGCIILVKVGHLPIVDHKESQ